MMDTLHIRIGEASGESWRREKKDRFTAGFEFILATPFVRAG
jgi:hypothetical protein